MRVAQEKSTVGLVELLGRGVAQVFIFLVRIYRWTLSPLKNALLGPAAGCRFRPTCSQYAIDCFKTLPLHKALWHATYRILRCNPWGGQGYDPAPGTVHLDGNFVPDGKKVTSLKDQLKK